MISLSNVSVSYPNSTREALSKLSLECAKGSFTIISGATGSGKSTLLRLLSAELAPSKGAARVAGFDLTKHSQKDRAEYRRSIGLVFQDFKLLEDKSIAENISFALDVLPARSRFDSAKRVDAVLARFGLTHLRDAKPRELSQGEKQRAAIARAVIREPYVLIADEPTAQLDEISTYAVIEALQAENTRGMTVLILGGDPDLYRSDRTSPDYYYLEEGKLSQIGLPDFSSVSRVAALSLE